jgi:hypothetical protein
MSERLIIPVPGGNFSAYIARPAAAKALAAVVIQEIAAKANVRAVEFFKQHLG